ncbi:MAG: PEGA domain-containing protein [Deltaproteobacteria bacterium]|nr:PEGA domain-containing protein [Deltaproteobacteria bacterium]
MRVLCSLITLALITLALTSSAHADSRREARDAFAKGEAADKRKDYRAAIEHYLHAYELAPHHFALYNIGIDYERLGEYRESAEWFNRYIKEAPPSPELDRVNRLLIELRLRPAKLTVTTKPPGARVFINDQYSGTTPFAKPVKGGGVRVRVELGGQRDERNVDLEYGEPKSMEFTLRTVAPPVGPTGTLEITGTPEGASVAINDQTVGTLPAKIEVIPGKHWIRVTQYGYQPFETTATVAINQTTGVMALLVQEGVTMGGVGDAGVLPIGYMFGVGGGIDLKSAEPIGLFDFGIRAGQYDIAIRAGKAAGYLAVDFLFRWAITKARLSPYIGVGYSYITVSGDDTTSMATGSGGGPEAVGGLRFDITRSMAGITTLILESGFRYHTSTPTDDMGRATSGLVIPLMASFQYTYGRAR